MTASLSRPKFGRRRYLGGVDQGCSNSLTTLLTPLDGYLSDGRGATWMLATIRLLQQYFLGPLTRDQSTPLFTPAKSDSVLGHLGKRFSQRSSLAPAPQIYHL